MKDFPEIYEDEKIEEMYNELAMPKEKVELLHKYFKAMSEFYQLISVKKAFKIINDQNNNEISKEEFIGFVKIIRHQGCEFFSILSADELYEEEPPSDIFDMEIVHDSLVEVDMEFYYSLAEEKEGNMYYVPPKEELLKYEDQFYYERTPYTEKLLNFFVNDIKATSENADDYVGECVLGVKDLECDVNFTLENLCSYGVKMTFEQEDTFVKNFLMLKNHTRMPYLCGYRPCDMSDYNNEHEQIKTIVSYNADQYANKDFVQDDYWDNIDDVKEKKTKIKPNEPFPCGSGKKYKKCCGR